MVGIETLHPTLIRAAVVAAPKPSPRIAALAADGLAGKARLAFALVVGAGLVAVFGLGPGGAPAGADPAPPPARDKKAAEVKAVDPPKDDKAVAGRVVDPDGRPVAGRHRLADGVGPAGEGSRPDGGRRDVHCVGRPQDRLDADPRRRPTSNST